ncbi:MAG: hypothetical protein QOE28_2198 [Solirubrobacteraceae bacterium]|nr:hypothetical protein [Solirubrobacteraceae bacterium]
MPICTCWRESRAGTGPPGLTHLTTRHPAWRHVVPPSVSPAPSRGDGFGAPRKPLHAVGPGDARPHGPMDVMMNQRPMMLSLPAAWAASPSRTLVVVGVAGPPPGTLL